MLLKKHSLDAFKSSQNSSISILVGGSNTKADDKFHGCISGLIMESNSEFGLTLIFFHRINDFCGLHLVT